MITKSAALLGVLAAGLSAQPERPALSVSVNGAQARIGSGSALLIAVVLVGADAEIRLGSVAMKLTDDTGAVVEDAPVTRRSVRAVQVESEEFQSAISVWTVAPDYASRPGKYTIAAVLEDSKIASAAFEIAADLPPDAGILSRWEQLEGNLDRALEIAERNLSEKPESISAIVRKAELLEAKGQYESALSLMESAINRLESDAEAPRQNMSAFHFRRNALLKSVLGDPEGSTEPRSRVGLRYPKPRL